MVKKKKKRFFRVGFHAPIKINGTFSGEIGWFSGEYWGGIKLELLQTTEGVSFTIFWIQFLKLSISLSWEYY